MSEKIQGDFFSAGDLVVLKIDCFHVQTEKTLCAGALGMIVEDLGWTKLAYENHLHYYNILLGEQVIRIWDAHIKRL